MTETDPAHMADNVEAPRAGNTAAPAQTGSDAAAVESQPAVSPLEPRPVSVEIFDQVYRLRGTDPEYLQSLAAIVDGKMRAVSAQGATVDSLRVAVLASLNIADELARLQQKYDALTGTVDLVKQGVRSRAGSLNNLLDQILEDRRSA